MHPFPERVSQDPSSGDVSARYCHRDGGSFAVTEPESRRSQRSIFYRGSEGSDSTKGGGWLVAGDQLGELCQVDVASADDADDFAGAALAGESSGDGAGPAPSAMTWLRSATRRMACRVCSRVATMEAGEEMLGERPHAGEDGLASAAVDKAGLPVGKFLCRAGGEREGERGCGFGFGSEDFGLVAACLEGGGDAAGQSATAEAGDDGIDVG